MTDDKRARVSYRTYLDDEGNESKFAGPETVAMQFKFTDGGTHLVTLADIGQNCRGIIAFHGLGAKLMDAYAGQKDKDETAEELFLAMLERLKADEWVARGERVGPTIGVLFEAVCRALTNAGKEVNEESIKEKIKGQEGRERALANPAINAAYETIRAERAAAKAQKAQEKAEGATLDEF